MPRGLTRCRMAHQVGKRDAVEECDNAPIDGQHRATRRTDVLVLAGGRKVSRSAIDQPDRTFNDVEDFQQADVFRRASQALTSVLAPS